MNHAKTERHASIKKEVMLVNVLKDIMDENVKAKLTCVCTKNVITEENVFLLLVISNVYVHLDFLVFNVTKVKN